MNSCAVCKHHDFDYEESDGHVVGAWHSCGARHGVSNLKQFPFRKTECQKFEKRVIRDIPRNPITGEMIIHSKERADE